MLLGDVADIRNDLNFDDMPDINEAIEAALLAAYPELVAALGTELTQATVTDFFYAPEPGFYQDGYVETKFKLRRGFVQALTEMARGPTRISFGTSGAIVFTDEVILDADRGFVSDYATPYFRQWVRITYQAGFAAKTGDPKSFDLDTVPDWLLQAAKMQAKLHLAGAPVMESAAVKINSSTLKAGLRALLSTKSRYAPTAILPA